MDHEIRWTHFPLIQAKAHDRGHLQMSASSGAQSVNPSSATLSLPLPCRALNEILGKYLIQLNRHSEHLLLLVRLFSRLDGTCGLLPCTFSWLLYYIHLHIPMYLIRILGQPKFAIRLAFVISVYLFHSPKSVLIILSASLSRIVSVPLHIRVNLRPNISAFCLPLHNDQVATKLGSNRAAEEPTGICIAEKSTDTKDMDIAWQSDMC